LSAWETLKANRNFFLTRAWFSGYIYYRLRIIPEIFISRSNPMIETIKSIILDFQETQLETGVPRRLRIKTVHGKAAVCIGVRRSGKSTYMFQVIQQLMDSGIPRQNILYVNFFDDRLHNLRQDNLGLIAEAYYSLYPEK
jgi:hypothetical protein